LYAAGRKMLVPTDGVGVTVSSGGAVGDAGVSVGCSMVGVGVGG
jgi:hypothetical protein